MKYYTFTEIILQKVPNDDLNELIAIDDVLIAFQRNPSIRTDSCFDLRKNDEYHDDLTSQTHKLGINIITFNKFILDAIINRIKSLPFNAYL